MLRVWIDGKGITVGGACTVTSSRPGRTCRPIPQGLTEIVAFLRAASF